MPDPRRSGFQNKFWKGNGFLSSHISRFAFNNVGNKNIEAAVGSCASIMIKNKWGTSFVGSVSNLMFPHWDNQPSPERLAHRSELPGIGSARHVFSKLCVHGWNEGQRIINLALPQKLVLVTTLGHACQNVFEASPLQEKQPTTRKCLIGQHVDDANQQITHHNRCMKKTCVRFESSICHALVVTQNNSRVVTYQI